MREGIVMGYSRSGYRRGSSGGGSRWMTLKYRGTCKVCGELVAAGQTAFWDAAAKAVTCERIECAAADGLTETKRPTGPWDRFEAHEVIRDAPVGGSYRVGSGVVVSRFNSGAVVYQNARGRCEDAPCCGCCS